MKYITVQIGKVLKSISRFFLGIGCICARYRFCRVRCYRYVSRIANFIDIPVCIYSARKHSKALYHYISQRALFALYNRIGYTILGVTEKRMCGARNTEIAEVLLTKEIYIYSWNVFLTVRAFH